MLTAKNIKTLLDGERAFNFDNITSERCRYTGIGGNVGAGEEGEML